MLKKSRKLHSSVTESVLSLGIQVQDFLGSARHFDKFSRFAMTLAHRQVSHKSSITYKRGLAN